MDSWPRGKEPNMGTYILSLSRSHHDTTAHSVYPMLCSPDILQAAGLGASGKCISTSCHSGVWMFPGPIITHMETREHVWNSESRRNVKISCISCERRKCWEAVSRVAWEGHGCLSQERNKEEVQISHVVLLLFMAVLSKSANVSMLIYCQSVILFHPLRNVFLAFSVAHSKCSPSRSFYR